MTDVDIGTLGSSRLATLTSAGDLEVDGGSVAWRIGADDRWHVPSREAAVRQFRRGAAPVYDTVVRIPGGDAHQTVYVVDAGNPVVVIEVENASPAPFALGFVGNGLVFPRAPTREVVAREALAMLPVTHRTRVRVALPLDGVRDVDLASLPDADAVERGWHAQLDRGLRVVLPDEQRQALIDAARGDALVRYAAEPSVEVFVDLEDWGFDGEAVTVWNRLSSRDRRRARVRTHLASSSLRETRDLLVDDRADLRLLREWPSQWGNGGFEVHDAPTRFGRVSYAVRWHGARPALLWEVDNPGVTITCPALDSSWSTREPRGEALL